MAFCLRFNLTRFILALIGIDRGRGKRMSGLLQIRRVAELLDCTERHVRVLIHQGELAGVELGPRSWRVTKKSLEQFLSKHRIDPLKFDA
jgi:excisionase family DNA binding protein